MTEYIEREEINEAMKEVCDDPSCPMYVAAEIAQIIDCAPAADVVPVVHGKWIWHKEEFEYECSACYCRFDYNPTFENFEHGFHYANWCPYCGAKMDGGADND